MSKLFDNMLAKFFAVIVIILFIVGFREMILTDRNVSNAFGELMGILPFAEPIVNAACTILGYQYEIPIISTSSVLTDLIRLTFMACLQPIVIGILTRIFLPIPSGLDVYQQEEYMNRLGYRIKELILTVIFTPLLAAFASWLSSAMFTFFTNTFGSVLSVISGILVVLIVAALSLFPLLATGTALGVALLWRLLVTFGSKMVATFVTSALCLVVYVAILGGIQGQIATSIIALVIWLIIMDFGLNCLRRAVVSTPKRY